MGRTHVSREEQDLRDPRISRKPSQRRPRERLVQGKTGYAGLAAACGTETLLQATVCWTARMGGRVAGWRIGRLGDVGGVAARRVQIDRAKKTRCATGSVGAVREVEGHEYCSQNNDKKGRSKSGPPWAGIAFITFATNRPKAADLYHALGARQLYDVGVAQKSSLAPGAQV